MRPLRIVQLVILLAIVWLLVLMFYPAHAKPQDDCVDAKLKEQIRELALQAFDDAFRMHIAKLFEVWLKDFTPEPKQAMVGMANNIQAYKRARDNALQWDPPDCQ